MQGYNPIQSYVSPLVERFGQGDPPSTPPRAHVVSEERRHAEWKRLLGRWGATLFFASGVITAASVLLPVDQTTNRSGIMLVGTVAILVAIIDWNLPWHRWRLESQLWLVPIAFALIAMHNHFGGAEPYRYGLFFIVVYAWIGVGHSRWTGMRFVPILTIAYLIPLWTSGYYSPAAASSVVFAVPICLLVGETLAWVSQRLRQTEFALYREARFRALVANSSDLIALIGAGNTVLYISPAAEWILGYRPEELVGYSIFDRIHPEDIEQFRSVVSGKNGAGGVAPPLELRYQHADGRWHYVEATVNNRIDDPAVGGVIVTVRDVSERKGLEAQLQYQAFHDSLTDLPNRAHFLDRLERALARADRLSEFVAVIYLDLDNFKVINDSLGHETGDRFLVALADRLRKCLQSTGSAARLGGDEFTVLLEDVSGANDAIDTAKRIATTLQSPFNVEGHQLYITVSMGIALNGSAGDSAHDLLRTADVALYRAKRQGKACYQLYEPCMKIETLARLDTERDLHHALDRSEFRLDYQPIVNLATGRVREMEALIRWQHPTLGLVPPGEFIPLAEEVGLIVPIGRWVLQEACRQARRWQTEQRSGPALAVSVNVSARQFRDPQLISDIEHALANNNLAAGSLRLEVTETLMMQDTDNVRETLKRLQALGVQIAIDDFGTGYSSLSYLKQLPVDILKIDRSFIQGLTQSSADRALVEAVMVVARALGLTVTAEGIETADQLAVLRSLGCDQGQGFYLAKPAPGAMLDARWSRPSQVSTNRHIATLLPVLSSDD